MSLNIRPERRNPSLLSPLEQQTEGEITRTNVVGKDGEKLRCRRLLKREAEDRNSYYLRFKE
jgi:hypothetical protein